MNSYKINMLDKSSVDIVNTEITLDELRSMISNEVVLIIGQNTILNMKYVVSIKQMK